MPLHTVKPAQICGVVAPATRPTGIWPTSLASARIRTAATRPVKATPLMRGSPMSCSDGWCDIRRLLCDFLGTSASSSSVAEAIAHCATQPASLTTGTLPAVSCGPATRASWQWGKFQGATQHTKPNGLLSFQVWKQGSAVASQVPGCALPPYPKLVSSLPLLGLILWQVKDCSDVRQGELLDCEWRRGLNQRKPAVYPDHPRV